MELGDDSFSGILLEHQKHDEAWDLSESDELESSIETNPSPAKRRQSAQGDSPPHFSPGGDSPPRQDGMGMDTDSESDDSDGEHLSRRLGLDESHVTPVAASQPAAATLESERESESESEGESESESESEGHCESESESARESKACGDMQAGVAAGAVIAPSGADSTGLATSAPPKDPNEYDSTAYVHCGAESTDLHDLFRHISAFAPPDTPFAATLKSFVPDYMPATGEPDCFLHIPRPDGRSSGGLGAAVLSEPCAQQSDASVVELQLRAASKRARTCAAAQSAKVRSIERAHEHAGKVEQWVRNVEMVHRRKPPAAVHYSGAMPDVEDLMQTWHPEVDALLSGHEAGGRSGGGRGSGDDGGGRAAIPDLSAMDLSLDEQARVVCGMLGIPVRPGRKVESLHLLFTLFAEFKDNQHFAQA